MITIIIDYGPLWATMEEKGISQYRLLKDGIIDNKTLDSLKKGKNVTALTLGRLCLYLECTADQIVQFRQANP